MLDLLGSHPPGQMGDFIEKWQQGGEERDAKIVNYRQL